MAEIEKHGTLFKSKIACNTIAGVYLPNIIIKVDADNPDLLVIGTMSGFYSVNFRDVSAVVSAALEEANKGV